MDLSAPAAIANRLMEPLTHPLTAVVGSLLPASLPDGRTFEAVLEAAVRLLGLLLAL